MCVYVCICVYKVRMSVYQNSRGAGMVSYLESANAAPADKVRMCMCVYVCVRCVCVCVCIHTYMSYLESTNATPADKKRTYMYIYIHTYIHVIS